MQIRIILADSPLTCKAVEGQTHALTQGLHETNRTLVRVALPGRLGVQQEAAQGAKPFKVVTRILRKVWQQPIEIGKAGFQHLKALEVEAHTILQKINHAPADNSIKCHQLPFVRA